jgi:tetratricopeptide (TPR) repeat protein
MTVLQQVMNISKNSNKLNTNTNTLKMKSTILMLIYSLLCFSSFGQNKADAEKLVGEGIAYHDKGDYEGAILRYDKALKLDKENLLAMAEKAISLLSFQKYEDAINLCQKAIAAHPGDNGLTTVYVTYGNASDGLKKTDKSIAIYDEGIRQFPDYYPLYFNKGISLASVKKHDEAILCFQKAIILNPKHGSSHNAIARLSSINNKRIPALLAYCRFLTIDQLSNRAKENLSAMQKLMKGNAKETGEKSVTINISSDMLGDTKADGKSKENSFTATDLLLAMDAALDFDEKNKRKTEVEQFIRKFQTVCASLKETKKDNYGFFWNYYVPYFTAMNDKDFLETFSYIAFASSDDPEIAKWLNTHKNETDKFFEWSKSFEFKSN